MERKIAAYYPIVDSMACYQRKKYNIARFFRNTKYANPNMKIDYEYVDYYLGRDKNSPLFRLSMLMEDCRDGRIELILVCSCRNFGRNSEETLAIVRELLSLPKPVGVYFEYENINTLEDTDQEKLKEALKYWDYDQQLKRRKRRLADRVIHNQPITGEGMILELKKGRYMIYVTSDIHGNSKRFDSILEQIKLQPEDTLYILGDVIDRYPDGIALLQRIMKMPNVQMLLGNHEYMMLNYLAGSNHDEVDWNLSDWSEVRRLWFDNGGRPTYYAIKTLTGEELQKIKMFLKALPINIDIEVNGQKYKLVHASNKDDFADSGLFGYYENETEYAVWKRWRMGEPTPKDHIRVCGHTPTITYQKDNPLKIWYGDNIIAIDCGAGFPKEQPYERIYYKGRLSCLRLDDMKEFYSEEEY